MAADYQIKPFICKPASQLALFIRSFRYVLESPMNSHDAKIDLLIFNTAQVGSNLSRIDEIDMRRREGLITIASIRAVEESNPKSLHFHNERITLRAIFRRTIGTHIRAITHLIKRALHSPAAAVKHMVIGHHENIETGIFQGVEITVGAGEVRISGIGFARQGRFKIHNRKISTLQKRTNVAKIGLKIIRISRSIVRPLKLWAMNHCITSKD